MINITENVNNKINHSLNQKLILIHGNYTINVDLMTCNYVFSKSEQTIIEKLIHEEMLFVNSNCKNPFNDYSIDEEVIWIDGVSITHMDKICICIYDLTQKYHD